MNIPLLSIVQLFQRKARWRIRADLLWTWAWSWPPWRIQPHCREIL